jgi:hypothetical protein
MVDDREPLRRWAEPAQSVGAMLMLLWLSHRALARMEAHHDVLLLSAFRGMAKLEWVCPYLIAVAVACAIAVVRRSRAALVRIQWVALGCGLFLTLHGLGERIGDKFDPRWALAVLGGVASLYSCYACLLGYAALSVLPRNISSRRLM